MTDYILKAVAEYREMIYNNTKQIGLPDGTSYTEVKLDAIDFEQFLTQKLEHLARQKDEEFMGIIGEDEKEILEDSYKGRGRPAKTRMQRISWSAEIRNKFRAELRNKLNVNSMKANDNRNVNKLQGGKA